MRKDARETAFRILYSRLYNDGDSSPLFEELSKEAKHCKQSTVFSASACNGSNNGSGAW